MQVRKGARRDQGLTGCADGLLFRAFQCPLVTSINTAGFFLLVGTGMLKPLTALVGRVTLFEAKGRSKRVAHLPCPVDTQTHANTKDSYNLLTLLLLATVIPTATGVCQEMRWDDQGWPLSRTRFAYLAPGQAWWVRKTGWK